MFLTPPGFPADFPPPPFLGFLLGYVLGVFMKGSGGGMSLLNWNLDSNSPTNREETKQAMILAVINAIYAIAFYALKYVC